MSIYSNIPSGAFFEQVEIVIMAASSDDAGTLASPVGSGAKILNDLFHP